MVYRFLKIKTLDTCCIRTLANEEKNNQNRLVYSKDWNKGIVFVESCLVQNLEFVW